MPSLDVNKEFSRVDPLRTWFVYKNSSDIVDINHNITHFFPAANNITAYGPDSAFFLPYLSQKMTFSSLTGELNKTISLMDKLDIHSNIKTSVQSLVSSPYYDPYVFFPTITQDILGKLPNCIAFADTSKKWCNPPSTELSNFTEICDAAKNMMNLCSKSTNYSKYRCEYSHSISFKDGEVLIYTDFVSKPLHTDKTSITHAAVYNEPYGMIFSKLGQGPLATHSPEDLGRVPSLKEICENFNVLKPFAAHNSHDNLLHDLLIKSAALSIYDSLGVSKTPQDIAKTNTQNILTDLKQQYETESKKSPQPLKEQIELSVEKVEKLSGKIAGYDQYIKHNGFDLLLHKLVYNYDTDCTKLSETVSNSSLGLKYFLQDIKQNVNAIQGDEFTKECYDILTENTFFSTMSISPHGQMYFSPFQQTIERCPLQQPSHICDDLSASLNDEVPTIFGNLTEAIAELQFPSAYGDHVLSLVDG